MENKEFSKKLEGRTKVFAIKIIKLSASLPNTEISSEFAESDELLSIFASIGRSLS